MGLDLSQKLAFLVNYYKILIWFDIVSETVDSSCFCHQHPPLGGCSVAANH